jgi:phosphomannomutase
LKTLVIHPKDSTTDFLTEIYSDKNWTVINTNTSKKILKEQIKAHDRIVMLGHGTKYGLMGYKKLVIDSSWVYLLREKECVCIWCNADLFVKQYGLKGFYTGMIISEYEEALDYTIQTNSADLLQSNLLFAEAVKKSVDTEDIVASVKEIYKGDNAVIMFNQDNLYFKA